MRHAILPLSPRRGCLFCLAVWFSLLGFDDKLSRSRYDLCQNYDITALSIGAMAFPVHAIRLMAMQYRPVPRLRASKRASTSDDEARIVREERESYDDDLFVDKLVVERITRTLKAKGREHEVNRRRLRDLKMEAAAAEKAIASHASEAAEIEPGEKKGEGNTKGFRSKKKNILGKKHKKK